MENEGGEHSQGMSKSKANAQGSQSLLKRNSSPPKGSQSLLKRNSSPPKERRVPFSSTYASTAAIPSSESLPEYKRKGAAAEEDKKVTLVNQLSKSLSYERESAHRVIRYTIIHHKLRTVP